MRGSWKSWMSSECDRNDRLEAAKRKAVQRIFLKPADQDYACARLLWVNGAHEQFCWSAAQSLEKYMKGTLAISNEKAPKSHDLLILLDILREASDLRNLTPFLLPPQIECSQFASYYEVETARQSLQRINANGSPDRRYGITDINLEPFDLLLLDHFVYFFRSLLAKNLQCERVLFHPSNKNVHFRADSPEALIRNAENERNPSLANSLEFCNFAFFPELVAEKDMEKIAFYKFSRGLTSAIQFADQSIRRDLVNWMLQNIMFSKPEKQKLRSFINER